jgi:GT2 family glycosyltransferase
MSEPPPEIGALAHQRDAARAARDFGTADALRAQIAEAGWTVVDEPGGWRLEAIVVPEPSGPPPPLHAKEVRSVWDAPPTADVSVHWVCEGWPDDIRRAIASFRRFQGERTMHFVVADVTGEGADGFGEDVEVVSLVAGTGWGAAANAGLRRASGALVFVMDGSIELAGDVFSALEQALADPAVGIAGPFGIVTQDLRQFNDCERPGSCDAVEGYFMALRRPLLADAGLFDEKFRWYRSADIEYSFRVKDLGRATVVVDVPVIKHEHRMWFSTEPAERARWSKRNYYRFLDRWRDRWDLVLDPHPPEHHHDDDHGH